MINGKRCSYDQHMAEWSSIRRPAVGAAIWIAWALIVAIGVWSLIGGVGVLILAMAGIVAVLLARRDIPGWMFGVGVLALIGAWVWLAGRL